MSLQSPLVKHNTLEFAFPCYPLRRYVRSTRLLLRATSACHPTLQACATLRCRFDAVLYALHILERGQSSLYARRCDSLSPPRRYIRWDQNCCSCDWIRSPPTRPSSASETRCTPSGSREPRPLYGHRYFSRSRMRWRMCRSMLFAGIISSGRFIHALRNTSQINFTHFQTGRRIWPVPALQKSVS